MQATNTWKLIWVAALALAACGNAELATTPDGGFGPGSGAGAGSGAGTGSGSGCAQGCARPTISVVSAKVADERGDLVDFSSGEPIHTHAGPLIDLGGTGCPDVYMYAYLMGVGAPPFGGETTSNPLAWRLQAEAPAGVVDTSYRVRADDGTVLLDWTPVAADGQGDYTVALHRDGDHPIARLGTSEGRMFLDVRVRDALGQETAASYCWNYHPIAAPLEIRPVAEESAGESLFRMTLAGDAPVSDVLQQDAQVPQVFGQRFVQHTAEPIQLDITIAPPTGQYSKVIADHYVKTGIGTMSCGTLDTYSTDPRCSPVTRVTSSDATASGELASGRWSAVVIDETTGDAASVCAVSGLHATCTIPPRGLSEAPHAYRIVTFVDGVGDLWPTSTGPFAEYTVAGRTYTGRAPVATAHCDVRSKTTSGLTTSFTCAYSTYEHIVALDRAIVSFDPFEVSYRASVGEAVPLSPVPYAPVGRATGALTWDSGADILPGQ